MPVPLDDGDLPSAEALLAAVVDQLDRTVRSLADEVVDYGGAWGVHTPSLPLVWTLNALRVPVAMTTDEVLTLADRHQADAHFRHVVVTHGATAARLEADLAPAGWRVEHEVNMVLREPAERVVDTAAVVALGESQMLELMRRWRIEEHPDISADGLDQLDEYERREGALWHERVFGVLAPDGDAVALTKLRQAGDVVWVEDVYTVPEARRRGHARALVTHVTDLARATDHDFVFIIADDDDWPKHLYASVGFRPVGVAATFHREVAPQG